jgi:hypothetical protein
VATAPLGSATTDAQAAGAVEGRFQAALASCSGKLAQLAECEAGIAERGEPMARCRPAAIAAQVMIHRHGGTRKSAHASASSDCARRSLRIASVAPVGLPWETALS